VAVGRGPPTIREGSVRVSPTELPGPFICLAAATNTSPPIYASSVLANRPPDCPTAPVIGSASPSPTFIYISGIVLGALPIAECVRRRVWEWNFFFASWSYLFRLLCPPRSGLIHAASPSAHLAPDVPQPSLAFPPER
jgi:hypothetical protein